MRILLGLTALVLCLPLPHALAADQQNAWAGRGTFEASPCSGDAVIAAYGSDRQLMVVWAVPACGILDAASFGGDDGWSGCSSGVGGAISCWDETGRSAEIDAEGNVLIRDFAWLDVPTTIRGAVAHVGASLPPGDDDPGSDPGLLWGRDPEECSYRDDDPSTYYGPQPNPLNGVVFYCIDGGNGGGVNLGELLD